MQKLLTEDTWLETAKNVADLGQLKSEAYDRTCIDLCLSLVSFFRDRQLNRMRDRQEALWEQQAQQDQAGASNPFFVFLLCASGSAVVATILGWYWWAALLSVGVCGLSWLMMRADEQEDRR